MTRPLLRPAKLALGLAAALLSAVARAAPPAAASDADQLRDIRGPIVIPPPWWHHWPYAAAALGAALVIALGVAGVRRWRRRAEDPTAAARRRLREARRLFAAGDVRGFAHAVSEALRGYIEARFAVHAPRRTTEEFLAEIAGEERSPLAAHRPLLAEFLDRADRAKFGGYHLDAAEADLMETSALAFVDATARPTPRDATAGGAP